MTVDIFTGALAGLSLLWLVPLTLTILGSIIYAVYNDEFYPPIIGALGSLVALHFWSDVPVLAFLKTNYVLILKYTAYYFGIGIVWSFVKWYFFLLKAKDEYQRRKKEFLSTLLKKEAHVANEAREGKIHPAYQKEWVKEAKMYKLVPKASDNKARITTWMMYWSFSMIGTLLGDWLSQLWNAIYNLFGNMYDRISKAVFGDEYFGEN